jgi:hypothetical protein
MVVMVGGALFLIQPPSDGGKGKDVAAILTPDGDSRPLPSPERGTFLGFPNAPKRPTLGACLASQKARPLRSRSSDTTRRGCGSTAATRAVSDRSRWR